MKTVRTAIIIALTMALLGACQSAADDTAPTQANIAVLKGPTGIGAVKMMDDAENGRITSNDYNFEVVGAVDEIVPGLARGELDIAAVPANLAAVLYNNTDGGVRVLAIHTLGMIYVVENGDTIHSVADLRGREIIAAGKGGPQEFALNYILESNGLSPEQDLSIEWKSEHTEVVASVLAEPGTIALLPQPFVTTARMADDNIRMALDLDEEWNRVQAAADENSALIMGVMVARTDFIAENPALISDFLSHYAASIAFANDNVDECAALVGKYGLFPEEVARLAIPYCKITYINGGEMKDKYAGFLGVLHGQNPQAVGGALPSDEFYYRP